MPFTRSFFNPTLFRKNLSRSWPLWGGITLVGALFPLYLILSILNQGVVLDRSDFASFLMDATAYFLPAFTCGYAVLVAMFVWSYLHNPRAVGMMHSLAVSRTNLFVTNTLSGLAMLIIPYIVVGGALCITAACCGAFHGGAVLTAVAAVILESLLFFGMGTLCATVTGNIFAVAVYYLVLNFAVPALDLLINSLAQQFIFGLTGALSDLSVTLSPVMGLYRSVNITYSKEGVRLLIPEFHGLGVIAAYGGVGILLLGISFVLYRSRRSESAGDVVAFGWLRPVFRICISVASALTLGRVLYEMFWASLFQQGEYAEIIPMGICMMLTAVIGYYAATMLLEKTLRVFRGSIRGVAVVCAVTAVLCAATSLDILGIEGYVPQADEIETVELNGNVCVLSDGTSMPGLTADILAFHEAVIADKDYIRSFGSVDYDSRVCWTYNSIVYTLKDGSKVEREYRLPVTQERSRDKETYDGKMLAIICNGEALMASVSIPEGAAITNMTVEYYDPVEDHYTIAGVEAGDLRTIYDALLRDAREGNFALENNIYWAMDEKFPTGAMMEQFDYHTNINLEYRIPNGENPHLYRGIYRLLQPTMKHTLQALVDCGIVTPEIIEGWNEAD